jgi:hypothetical protein
VEFSGGEAEERVCLGIEHGGNTEVIRDEGGDDTEDTTGLGAVDAEVECTSSENGECGGEEAEEGDEANALAHGHNPEIAGDHAPGEEIDADGVLKLGLVGVGGDDTAAWEEDRCIGQPEDTIGRERCCAEYISLREFPHAREELGKATAEDGHTDHDIGVCDVSCLDVVQGEDKCRGREGKETKRGRVGDAAAWAGGRCAIEGLAGFEVGSLVAHGGIQEEVRWGLLGEVEWREKGVSFSTVN